MNCMIKTIESLRKAAMSQIEMEKTFSGRMLSNVQVHKNSLTDSPLNKLTFFQFI